MSSNVIRFTQLVDKKQFDLIILLMLHDACHDFDNDKSSVAFKELFLKNKVTSVAQGFPGGMKRPREEDSSTGEGDARGNPTRRTQTNVSQQLEDERKEVADSIIKEKRQALKNPSGYSENVWSASVEYYQYILKLLLQ